VLGGRVEDELEPIARGRSDGSAIGVSEVSVSCFATIDEGTADVAALALA
jgi:hypothetical protein